MRPGFLSGQVLAAHKISKGCFINSNIGTVANRGILELLSEHHLLHEMRDVHYLIARRAFTLFADGGFIHGHDLDDWFPGRRGAAHPAPVELRETDSEFCLRVELPGFQEDEIVVAVGPLRVIICAEHQKNAEPSKEKMLYCEWRSSRVFRSFNHPTSINPRKASRRRSDGVLEIRLLKSAVEKSESGRLAA